MVATRKALERVWIVRWSKRAVPALVALAGVALAVRAWMPKPVPVDSRALQMSKLEIFVEEDGRTRVRDRYVVYAPLGAELERIRLEPGDHVEEGAVLARFVPPSPQLLDANTRAELEARLTAAGAREAQAHAVASRAEVAHRLAVRELERARALAEAKTMTPVAHERAEAAERIARQDLASAELDGRVAAAEVKSVRALLGRLSGGGARAGIEVVAPVSGDVLRVLRESAGPVAMGTPLVELGDPRAIEVVVDVLSADAVRLAAGAYAEIDAWGGDRVLRGRVRLLEPAAFTRVSALGVEEQRVNVVIALDEVPPGLGDGFRVEARVLEWAAERVLAVPRSALFKHEDSWAVFVIEDGRAHLRDIEVGRRARLEVEARSGLAPGDRVVIYPGEEVRDGVAVAVR